MNATTFRSHSERVSKMRELLSDPTLAQAIVVLRDEMPQGDVHDSADALSSVRKLARQSGYILAIDTFLSLAEPLAPDIPEVEPSWGVDLSKFELAEP